MQTDAVSRSSKAARTRGSDPRELPPVSLVPKRNRLRNKDSLSEHWLEIMTEARELGLSAATDFEVAQHFGVHQVTIDMWKRRHPEFAKALQLGKDIADEKVVATLYHKARGYSFVSEKIFQHDGSIIRAETIEHVAPDTTAMIFWLKNRKRADWTDQTDINVTATVDLKGGDLRAVALAMLATMKAGLMAPIIEHETAEQPDEA